MDDYSSSGLTWVRFKYFAERVQSLSVHLFNGQLFLKERREFFEILIRHPAVALARLFDEFHKLQLLNTNIILDKNFRVL